MRINSKPARIVLNAIMHVMLFVVFQCSAVITVAAPVFAQVPGAKKDAAHESMNHHKADESGKLINYRDDAPRDLTHVILALSTVASFILAGIAGFASKRPPWVKAIGIAGIVLFGPTIVHLCYCAVLEKNVVPIVGSGLIAVVLWLILRNPPAKKLSSGKLAEHIDAATKPGSEP